MDPPDQTSPKRGPRTRTTKHENETYQHLNEINQHAAITEPSIKPQSPGKKSWLTKQASTHNMIDSGIKISEGVILFYYNFLIKNQEFYDQGLPYRTLWHTKFKLQRFYKRKLILTELIKRKQLLTNCAFDKDVLGPIENIKGPGELRKNADAHNGGDSDVEDFLDGRANSSDGSRRGKKRKKGQSNSHSHWDTKSYSSSKASNGASSGTSKSGPKLVQAENAWLCSGGKTFCQKKSLNSGEQKRQAKLIPKEFFNTAEKTGMKIRTFLA
jgi:hypothetical protein